MQTTAVKPNGRLVVTIVIVSITALVERTVCMDVAQNGGRIKYALADYTETGNTCRNAQG